MPDEADFLLVIDMGPGTKLLKRFMKTKAEVMRAIMAAPANARLELGWVGK